MLTLKTSDAPVKRTAVERQVNMQILYLFILLLILSLVTTIGNSIRTVGLSVSELMISGSTRTRCGTCFSIQIRETRVCSLSGVADMQLANLLKAS
jgi:hypothetical protein